MKINRRDFIKWCTVCSGAFGFSSLPRHLLAQTRAITPVVPGPEIDQFKKAQQNLLLKYGVPARSRYLKLNKPLLTTHVLEAGRGTPLLLLHGGGATGCQFASLMSSLQKEFHLFAPDRPGCGLTDKINYRGVPLRQHAVDFVTSIMDGLKLPKAAIVANSMGGYWALVFALAHPERVTRLVLIGEPAGSSPPQPNAPGRPPTTNMPTIESTRALYQFRLVANVNRVPIEMLEEDLAAARLPGAMLAWDTMIEEFIRQQLGAYNLRPELKGLRPTTLFAWGDKDKFGPPSLGEEMAAMAQHARCEVVQDAGHIAWLDQPERCGRLTVEFLKAVR